MTTPKPSDRCWTCGQTFEWHEDHKPVHPFNFGQDGATAVFKRAPDRDHRRTTPTSPQPSQGPQMMSLPTDPVLRIALVNKGVLTPVDLVAAEEQLRQAIQEVVQSGEGKVQVGTAASVDVGQRTGSGQEVGAQSEHVQE